MMNTCFLTSSARHDSRRDLAEHFWFRVSREVAVRLPAGPRHLKAGPGLEASLSSLFPCPAVGRRPQFPARSFLQRLPLGQPQRMAAGFPQWGGVIPESATWTGALASFIT